MQSGGCLQNMGHLLENNAIELEDFFGLQSFKSGETFNLVNEHNGHSV
jgi:hypothetical protein